jgi:rhodanese-related sulfurtransferase
VQATDEFIGVRNSRVVLVDPAGVRSVMTASWLVQMGWNDVFVLEPEKNGDVPHLFESGPRTRPAIKEWPTVESPGGATVIDFSTSLRFRASHVPGAWWAVRSRLADAHARIGAAKDLVLTSEDGRARASRRTGSAALWPEAKVRVLEGGNAAWKAAGGALETGTERATTTLDDVWYKPYDHGANAEKHARDYLEWEVALVEQIKRDPTIRFRAF